MLSQQQYFHHLFPDRIQGQVQEYSPLPPSKEIDSSTRMQDAASSATNDKGLPQQTGSSVTAPRLSSVPVHTVL